MRIDKSQVLDQDAEALRFMLELPLQCCMDDGWIGSSLLQSSIQCRSDYVGDSSSIESPGDGVDSVF
jgi:hypothetical protein